MKIIESLCSNSTYRLFKRILEDGTTYIPAFLVLSGIGLVMIPIELYSLFLGRKLIDNGFLPQEWDTIKGVLFILIFLFLFRSVIHYGTAMIFTKIQLQIDQKYQDKLLSHIIHLPMRFFEREPTGQIMSRILDDATRFSSILNLLFGPALLHPIKLIALLIFLITMDIRLSLIMIISTCLSFTVIHHVGKRIRVISKAIQQTNAAIYSFIGQIFPNIELVKSKATEKKTSLDFNRLVDEFVRQSLAALKISLIAQPVLQLLKYISLGLVFISGGWMISRDLFTIGTLTIFLGATYIFFNILNSIGNTYGLIREDLARLEIIYDILDSPPEMYNHKLNKMPVASINSIEFKNVSFGYHQSTLVLKDVSFRISRGDFIGITGQSGSGKTTLARLLMGLYEPYKGLIELNGHNINEYDLKSLRLSIGIVFQENLILNSTIKDNILYGVNGISMRQIINASRMSCAYDFIAALPDQYNTVIGEMGKSLSGGERQRLAITRAIITNPEILILDEATSFLELKQEEIILNNLKQARMEKITLIISHRMSAIDAANRVLTLDNGSIINAETYTHFGARLG